MSVDIGSKSSSTADYRVKGGNRSRNWPKKAKPRPKRRRSPIWQLALGWFGSGMGRNMKRSFRRMDICMAARPIAVSARWPGRSRAATAEAGDSLDSSRVRSGGNASECTKEECPLCDLHPEKSRRGPRPGIQLIGRPAIGCGVVHPVADPRGLETNRHAVRRWRILRRQY